jgi:hypothetical protein
MSPGNSKTISLEDTFKCSFNSIQNPNSIQQQYCDFQNFYSHPKSKELAPYLWLVNWWSSLVILSCIPTPFLNLSFAIVLGYCVQYHTINKCIGRTMSIFLGLLFLTAQCVVWQFEQYLVWGAFIWLASMGGVLGSYYYWEKKDPTILFSDDSPYLSIVPLYCYAYLDHKHNIHQTFRKYISIGVNYIKRFSTSDIIRSDDTKRDSHKNDDDYGDYGDYSGISHSEDPEKTIIKNMAKDTADAAAAAALVALSSASYARTIANAAEHAVLAAEARIIEDEPVDNTAENSLVGDTSETLTSKNNEEDCVTNNCCNTCDSCDITNENSYKKDV